VNDPASGSDDERLKAAVRDGLLARDRAARAPSFASIWQAADSTPRFPYLQRPALAGCAAVVLLAGVSWIYLGRQTGEPARPDTEDGAVALARELSSPDYWRVPTDELLAFAAPPLSAGLPSVEGFNVSLEESLL